jgi:hypothetical protein
MCLKIDSIQKAVIDAIKILKEADFQSCHEVWKIHGAKPVTSERCYLEGDSVDLDE